MLTGGVRYLYRSPPSPRMPNRTWARSHVIEDGNLGRDGGNRPRRQTHGHETHDDCSHGHWMNLDTTDDGFYGLRLSFTIRDRFRFPSLGFSPPRKHSVGIGMHSEHGITHLYNTTPFPIGHPPPCFLFFLYSVFFFSSYRRHETCIWDMIPGVSKQGGLQATGRVRGLGISCLDT